MSATQVYQVQAPDGSILHIEGPADATDEQITAAAQAAYGEQADAPPPITGVIEWNGKKAEYTAPAGASDDQIREAGRAALVAAYPKVKFPDKKTIVLNDQRDHLSPQRDAKQYTGLGLRGIANGIGGLVDTMGGAMAPAAMQFLRMSGQPTVRDYTNAAMDTAGLEAPSTDNERLGSAAVEGATGAIVGGGPTSLGRAAMLGVSGGMSGAASEGTRQAGGGPEAQLAAGLVAGGGPLIAASAGRAALGSVGSRLPGVNPAPRAAATLQEAAFNPEQALANTASRPKPSYKTAPTLAEVAKDPGLAAFQRSRASTAIAEQQRANALARGDMVDMVGGKGKPQAVQDMAQTQAAQGEQAVTASREAIGPQMDRADSGAQVRGQFDAAHNAARAQTSVAYNDPALVAEPQPVNLTNQFHNDIEMATKPFYGDGSAPMSPELQTIVDDLRKPDATSARFGNIDRRLAEFSANVRRQGGSNTEAAAADQLRNVIEAHASQVLPPEQVAALQTARQTRAAQGQTFEQGNAAEAFATKRYGEPVRDNVELPPALVKPGPVGAATADRLELAIGKDATESTVRAELRRIADEGQITKTSQVQALVKKYGETLSRYPGLRNDLQRLHDRAALNEAFLKSPLGKVTEGDPATAIGKIVFGDDPAAANQLIGQIKDSRFAIAGLRRSFAELIGRAGKGDAVTAEGVNIPNPAKTAQAIDMVLARGSKAFTSQQRAVLQQVKGELDRVAYAEKAGVVKGAETEISPLDVIPNAKPGIGAVKRMLSWATNQKGVDALIEKALLDPAYAAELLGKPTPARLSRLKSTINASLTGAALGVHPEEQPQ